MILKEEQLAQFKEASKPLVKFLCDNFHPHVTVIVGPAGAELLEGSCTVKIEEFIRDQHEMQGQVFLCKRQTEEQGSRQLGSTFDVGECSLKTYEHIEEK